MHALQLRPEFKLHGRTTMGPRPGLMFCFPSKLNSECMHAWTGRSPVWAAPAGQGCGVSISAHQQQSKTSACQGRSVSTNSSVRSKEKVMPAHQVGLLHLLSVRGHCMWHRQETKCCNNLLTWYMTRYNVGIQETDFPQGPIELTRARRCVLRTAVCPCYTGQVSFVRQTPFGTCLNCWLLAAAVR